MNALPTGTGPRVLLRNLREAMARPGTAQARLDMAVRIIASNMVAEVCSVYLRRAGDILELFATEGLNPDAVHQTRLRIGEGLVGDIAAHGRPLNLPDAQAHPAFAYRPETGEEIYHSLMGVPIVRGGRITGVLVVQNRTMRTYFEEEVEALQTIAMVLAELAGDSDLIGRTELADDSSEVDLPHRFEGVALSDGLGHGEAVLHETRFEIDRTIAEDTDQERDRLSTALHELASTVDSMVRSQNDVLGREQLDILEAYKMFANDRGWIERLHEAVDSGLTAEAAVQRVQVDTRRRMNEIVDPYLRERLHDLEDLSNRLLSILTGRGLTAASGALPRDAIVIARNMGPAELLDYDRERLQAVVLEEGSPTSHVVIVAGALDIPVVGSCRDILERIEPGDPVIVDADHGQVFIRPGEDVQLAFRDNIAAREARQAVYAARKDVPAVTKDGVEIGLNMNAGLLVDLHHLEETGARGIGLFRTELQFMVRARFPKVKEQTELYARILDHAGDRSVLFRTLDIGSDKMLPYFNMAAAEENPAMGWRAIRIALDRPALLRSQLRALLQAAGGRSLHVMFPMVTEVAEFQAAKRLLDKELERLDRTGGQPPKALHVGTMLEVPALAWQLDALLPLVDFLSVGTNDLLQFFFASDRGNARLANRYDLLSPSILSFLRWVVRRCDRHGVPISICGDMAGHRLEAMGLIGLGFRSLSIPASAIGPVKEMICSLTVGDLEAYLKDLLDLPDHSLRGRLLNFAQDHGVTI